MDLKKKLIEVSKAIGYLQKDKTNKMQDYKYLSEAKIKETIKAAFEKQDIVFNYSTISVREYEISPTKSGTKQFLTIANGTYKFMDAESDTEISGTWYGSGSDTGDKGLYKAITGGIKYVLNTNFLIPSGDNPEKDDDKDKDKPPTKPDKPGIDPNLQLKKDLVKQFKGDKAAAKAEYEKIVAERKPEESEDELTASMEIYMAEKLGAEEV